jgi:hypothetical protein
MKHSVTHKITVSVLVVIEVVIFFFLLFYGFAYYSTNLEQRFFRPENDLLRSSGILGHGLGIFGSLFLVTGIFTYMARKRLRVFSRWGLLKNWLVAHIFLCSLGSVLILFHTTLRFEGLAAICFWCLVAVALSGVIGRYIYIQIPRTIEGRELSLNELNNMRREINRDLRADYSFDESLYNLLEAPDSRNTRGVNKNLATVWIAKYKQDQRTIKTLKQELKRLKLPYDETRNVIGLFKEEIILSRRIDRLTTMRRMFAYWHVIHLPVALVMLVLMAVHVVVVVVFGCRWIF